MEFSIEKYVVPNNIWLMEWDYQIKTRLEKETYIYLDILKADIIKQEDMKENISQVN